MLNRLHQPKDTEGIVDSAVQAVAERAQDHVDASRLAASLAALAQFGGRDDGGGARLRAFRKGEQLLALLGPSTTDDVEAVRWASAAALALGAAQWRRALWRSRKGPLTRRLPLGGRQTAQRGACRPGGQVLVVGGVGVGVVVVKS